MSQYYEIRVDGKTVYACSDESRFIREAAKYANVANATLKRPGGK
jgi:hypothetical protein